jgi:hypothetical protein
MFWRNISPLSSRSKGKPRKELSAEGRKLSCSACYLLLMVTPKHQTLSKLHEVTAPKSVFFIVADVNRN